MQNPGVFLVNTFLLKTHQNFKMNSPEVVQEVFPYEDLDYIEASLEPLLEILIQRGDLVLENEKELKNLEVSSEIASALEMIFSVWKMQAPKKWKNIFSQYPIWKEEELSTSEQVVKLLEKHHKYQLSLEHKKMVEEAKDLILIPSVYLGTQLGFNYVDSKLVIMVGVGNKFSGDILADKNQLEKEIYVKSFSALGEINRMSIMQELLQNEGSIESIQLAKQLNVTPATVSHHLKILRQAGLVSRSKSGREVHYVPEKARLEQIISFLRTILEGD